MQMIAINTVLEYTADDGSKEQEVVLWFDVESDSIVVFDLNDNTGFPVWKKYSDIQFLLESKVCKIVERELKRLAIAEEKISKFEREKWDEIWSIIKELVENEPQIYDEKIRAVLIKEAIEKNLVYKNYIYRRLRAYWKYGKTKNSLLKANYDKGGKGKVRNFSDRKRGRPNKDDSINNVGMNITHEVKEIFKKSYKEFYNTEKKMPLKLTYYKMINKYFNAVVFEGAKNKKTIVVPDGSKLPSFGAYKYWYRKFYNTVDTMVSRHGTVDNELNHRAVLGESTSEAYYPGSMYQIDATSADIYIVSRNNRDWIIGRPVIYMVIDVLTRYITGYYVGLEGPSWMGAMIALYNTARDKVELCKEFGIDINESQWLNSGLPDCIIADRGEMESTLPYNLINNLGVTIKILPPYRADWKGIVERNFGVFNTKAIHWLDGAVKREFRVRTDKDYREDALLNLYEFNQIIIRSIIHFNNAYMSYYERDEQMVADNVIATPSELWKWGIKNRGGLMKSFPDDVIKLNLMPTANARITYRGLLFKNLRYSIQEDIINGVYESARINGSKSVKISYDPRNMRYVYINEGLSCKKYTLLDKNKTSLYAEEVEFLNEFQNYTDRQQEAKIIADNVELEAQINEIVAQAKKDNQEHSLGRKKVKFIKLNRKNEKYKNREQEGWELEKESLGKEGEGILIAFGRKYNEDDYVPPPSYDDVIDGE